MKTISCSQAKQAGLKYYFTGTPCHRGHISDRFVRNGTCVECDYYRGHKASPASEALPQCRICGSQVRAHGHATCSPECKERRDKAKAAATYALTHRRACRGCGAATPRYKQFCSNECHTRYRIKPKPPKQLIPCAECGALFTPAANVKVCSAECRKRREAKQWRDAHIRQRERGAIAEYNRNIRAKVSAAVHVARDLGIVPSLMQRQRDENGRYRSTTMPTLTKQQRKRRREREQYAIMLAFKLIGLLQQQENT